MKELELLQDSDDDDSDSEGRRLSIADLDKWSGGIARSEGGEGNGG